MPRVHAPVRTRTVRDFVKKVEAKMKAKGMTVAELAHDTGLSRQYIYRILKHEHVPTLAVAESIASHLGLQITTSDVA
jgi:DNA-binding phage protein